MAKVEAASSGSGVSGKGEPGKISRLIAFFPASWEELKKVHSPSRQETWRMTVMVLWMIAFAGVLLGIVDAVLGRVMQMVLGI